MINCDRNIVSAPTITNKYRTDEILEALGTVFKNKCYLCEKKTSDASFFEIDHFIPVNEDIGKKYEWENLYLCCDDCNGARKKKTPAGGYLDPCNPNENVETEIEYILPPYKFNEPVFASSNVPVTDKVQNTIDQLKLMHYGTKRTQIKCASFRDVISKEATKLLALIIEESKAIRTGDTRQIALKRQLIENMLSEDAPFTMLMRYIAKEYRDVSDNT